jgi:hypothetical protein
VDVQHHQAVGSVIESSISMALSQRTFRFFVDRGGTFTDVVASVDSGDGAARVRVLKVRRATQTLTSR